jgi:hypothetical protein
VYSWCRPTASDARTSFLNSCADRKKKGMFTPAGLAYAQQQKSGGTLPHGPTLPVNATSPIYGVARDKFAGAAGADNAAGNINQYANWGRVSGLVGILGHPSLQSAKGAFCSFAPVPGVCGAPNINNPASLEPSVQKLAEIVAKETGKTLPEALNTVRQSIGPVGKIAGGIGRGVESLGPTIMWPAEMRLLDAYGPKTQTYA